MGKGDLKSRRGKLVNGSYGVRRRRKSNKPPIEPAAVEKKIETAPVKKAKPAAAAAKKPKETTKTASKAAPKTAASKAKSKEE